MTRHPSAPFTSWTSRALPRLLLLLGLAAWLPWTPALVPAGEPEAGQPGADEAGAEAEAEPLAPTSLEISLDAVPDFVYTDDAFEISLFVKRRIGPPETRFSKDEKYKAVVFEADLGRLGGWSEVVLTVPPDYEQAAPAKVLVHFDKLGHGMEIRLAARARGERPATAILAIRDAALDKGAGVTLRREHFVDDEGRRVIYRIPRTDETRHRRWRPLRELRDWAAGIERVALLTPATGSAAVGTAKGPEAPGPRSGSESQAVLDGFDETLRGRGVETTILPGNGAATPPCHALFLTALWNREALPHWVVVAPGTADLYAGTPTRDYAMALRGIVAAVGQKRRLILAAPPPDPARPARRARYVAVAREVATKHHLAWIDPSATASADASTEPSTEATAGREMGATARAITGRALGRAMAAGVSATPGLTIGPLLLLPLFSFALWWLYGHSRYRPSGAAVNIGPEAVSHSRATLMVRPDSGAFQRPPALDDSDTPSAPDTPDGAVEDGRAAPTSPPPTAMEVVREEQGAAEDDQPST